MTNSSAFKTDLNLIKPGMTRWTGNFLGGIFDRYVTATRETFKIALWHQKFGYLQEFHG
jgi:hypothetical protein